MIIDASNADENDSINIPLTKSDTIYNNNALITNVNSPNVRRLIGNVMNISIGLINTFIIPSSADAIIIAVAVSAENPVIIADAT